MYFFRRKKKKRNDTGVAQSPGVEVISIEKSVLTSSVTIPGELTSFNKWIFTRGKPALLKKLYVDVGSEVKEGQLLAVMEAPENYFPIGWGGIPLEIIGGNLHRSKRAINACSKQAKRQAQFHLMTLTSRWRK